MPAGRWRYPFSTGCYQSGLNYGGKFILSGRAFWFYLAKLILPLQLAPIYPKWEINTHLARQYIYPLAMLAFYAVLWLARKRIGHGPLLTMLFFAVTLSPMLGLIDFSFMNIAYVADRFQYLASIGPIALAAAVWTRGWEKRPVNSMSAMRTASTVICILLAVLTWRQAALYQDDETLFRRAVERNPQSAVAHLNLGAALTKHNRLDEARHEFEKAIELAPHDPMVHNNLGVVLAKQGDVAGAIRHYRAAMEHGGSWIKMVNDLAWFLATNSDSNLRDGMEAVRLAEVACSQTGYRDPAILDTLAAAYAEVGKFQEAVQTANMAAEKARKNGSVALIREIEKHAWLYQQRRPLREPRSDEMVSQ
ncbi:tetratricopeptide repeat protein [Candidatus Sumerlaeota bacterium]|nr:tetratricopeptide repeat protein [Candidatus Sumerlaeota bacterium]